MRTLLLTHSFIFAAFAAMLAACGSSGNNGSGELGSIGAGGSGNGFMQDAEFYDRTTDAWAPVAPLATGATLTG